MYYSYVEIEYVATSFSPARTDLALKLLNQELVTTTATVTSTMQIMEYHVKYNTTIALNPPEADHCCGRGKGKPKNTGYHCSNKYYLKV
jgi:hypothetical protein